MKIAQVVCVYPPYRGGIGKAAQINTDYLKNRGHEVTVFTPLPRNKKLSNDPNIVYIKPLLRMGNAAMLPSLYRYLNNFDLIILHYPFFGTSEIILLTWLLHKNNPKLIIHYHMDILELGFVKSIFTLPSILIRKKLFSMSDSIICSSIDYVQSGQLKDVYKAMPKKFYEMPFTVDSDLIKPRTVSQNNEINILFVGGMDKAHYFKGVDVLIKAVSEIENNQIKLNLVGNGELVEDYKKLCQDLKVSDKVSFYPGLSDKEVIDKYKKSDIFVLPSKNGHEAFGIVLIEAMSAGLPVIASDLPGVRKVFEDGKQGFLVRPSDVKQLKSKIEFLISNFDERKRMGEMARELVIEKYSRKKNLDNLENLIKSI